ncbi:endonuclease/exonuclease/phosphatase family protein [Streptomyces sp. NPDC046862]|uniref:endonuclease/exonuclease/phosphatase family protein n=1 Tax=Streptomyces sp. NPDC046862 TaxID=3154603 RepID=UPI0034544B1C
MTVRIATFNAENLFRRPKAFGLPDATQRNEVVEDFSTLVSLLNLTTYEPRDKARISALIKKHKAYDLDRDDPPPIYINQTRLDGGKLFKKQGQPGDDDFDIRILAKGRGDWAGWAELVREDLDSAAVENTGRVIDEVDADILLLVEVEDRLTLDRFNKQILQGALGRRPYPYSMLIDGNDSRGIDVGILSRHPITSVRPHIFDPDPERPGEHLFSRDCPEFEIQLNGTPLVLLGNHLKSKSNDDPVLRLAQAKRVAEIYEAARERTPYVMVAGDLNDHPESEPIALLLDTGLRDAMSHPAYRGVPGTYAPCDKAEHKIDYLLFPPPLWHRVQHVGLETRGIFWTPPPEIKHFDEVNSKVNAASDHAALYADLDL